MGRILLVVRLALRDLRRRRTEAALLLLAILAATTTLTLGLVLHDAASDPYQSTRAATKGPDVVAGDDPFAEPCRPRGSWPPLPASTEHSGPYPVIAAKLEASGRTSDVQVVGRDAAIAAVDQPELTQGSWVSDGGVVVEAAFANALDVRVGDSVTLGGRQFKVARPCRHRGHAALPGDVLHRHRRLHQRRCPAGPRPAPWACLHNPGLVWLTQADVLSLARTQDSTVLRDEPEACRPATRPRRSSTANTDERTRPDDVHADLAGHPR